ncbi:CynX/NimT family MFS transporter [Bradyrhizobium erythrophlei]|uniref:Nitrate/nitrite transporter NarK n=1 Tax=Bradyrhizobium erythrophlei TaxID=1437360 RepID=A0A1M7UL94_9BRAD|nr:MFS transporter [Bradyrhizobium erythrophlei]SHN83749.1 Nitrate/nitrite transporter NarK [Bradyrhizobium erythrophlei]
MRNRWFALAVLFVIRLTMAFQFQSVAAVAPLLDQKFGVSLADIGWLIGLYFAPGLFLALPGGAIGKRFGDKPTMIASLLLMLIGELAMALSSSWTIQIAGRLVSGAGGVMFNVQMTKMIADWFAGQEIATAMAIFVNSWPAGIALSLVFLPLIATASGVEAVHLTVAASIALGLVFFATAYPSPPKITAAAAGSSWPDRNTLVALIAAGLIWGLFNVGFAMIFSFGPSMLDERGWSISAAGSVISIVLWLAVISVPLGGILADRTGRPDLVLAGGCIIFAALMVVLPRTDAVVSVVTAIGLLSGLPVGPIMSLPARILKPETRAIGMGIFYTLYYGTMMLGPAVAGALAQSTGHAAAAIDFGTVVILACPLLLWAFNRLPEAQPKIA